MIQIGVRGDRHYYLEQNPLTKELRIEVHNWSTRKRRTYTNKAMMRKIFCMLIV